MNQTSMLALVEQYLACRRSLGFQLRIEGQLLLQFGRWGDEIGHTGPLTVDLALRWARLPAETTSLYQARRLEIVRCFARYRFAFDLATEIPPRGLLGPAHRRTTPFIYSREQIAALLPFHIWTETFATERLKWKPRSPLSVLLLQVYRCSQPISLPYRSEYGGCKSWIDLAELPGLLEAQPVLSEADYQRQVQAIQTAIGVADSRLTRR